jgi:hypothetical protein
MSRQPSSSSSSVSVPSLDQLFAGIDFSAMATNIAMRPHNGFGSGSGRMSAGRGYLPTPPHSPFGRQQTQGQGTTGGHRGKSIRNRSEFQFWPQGMAMGSLVGNQFLQVRFVISHSKIVADEIDPGFWV